MACSASCVRLPRTGSISTVENPARAQDQRPGIDGYKVHIAVDPDSEIITATRVTPGNSGDAEAPPAFSPTCCPPKPKVRRCSVMPSTGR
ncbi:transposase [Nocardia sp. NPDC050408]|uniref:transposase n=1 Tax=Nocardia sp. NPDC050408 TaxID=3364319 RepID=UPI0037B344B8